MSVLSYNEITPKRIIVHNNEPHMVLSSHVFRKQKSKPVNITKLRSIISGRVIEETFHQSDTAIEAYVETKPIEFIYGNKNEYWFCTPKKSSERFSLSTDLVGTGGKFLKSKSVIDAIVHEEKIVGITVPIKVDLTVKEAAPAVKGNTSSGATKEAVLETGAVIQVPLFINEGDVVRVNTETELYTGRAQKA